MPIMSDYIIQRFNSVAPNFFSGSVPGSDKKTT
jgi:hypothetical protein